jgi:hypothetical protein
VPVLGSRLQRRRSPSDPSRSRIDWSGQSPQGPVATRAARGRHPTTFGMEAGWPMP